MDGLREKRGVKACSSLIPEGGRERVTELRGQRICHPRFSRKTPTLIPSAHLPTRLLASLSRASTSYFVRILVQEICGLHISKSKKNTGIGYRYTYSPEHLLVLPQKVCFQSLELFVVTLLTHRRLVDPNVDLFAGMKKKKKKVTVADTEETPEPSPAPAVETPVPVAAAPVAEAEAKTEAPAPVATPEPSAEQPVEDSGDLFADLKKKKKKKKDIPLDLVRFFRFPKKPRILDVMSSFSCMLIYADNPCWGWKCRNLPNPLLLLTVLMCP